MISVIRLNWDMSELRRRARSRDGSSSSGVSRRLATSTVHLQRPSGCVSLFLPPPHSSCSLAFPASLADSTWLRHLSNTHSSPHCRFLTHIPFFVALLARELIPIYFRISET
ncbi:hypothetical protein BC835DRAFT_655263 [Cytidiella melzeri]|nr:hypothetical protein BC835DRAFT_655263 [Cytidiella melzeri]